MVRKKVVFPDMLEPVTTQVRRDSRKSLPTALSAGMRGWRRSAKERVGAASSVTSGKTVRRVWQRTARLVRASSSPMFSSQTGISAAWAFCQEAKRRTQ